MIDVIDLVPSKDMQRALREDWRELTDFEKAVIVYNLDMPYPKMRPVLEEIAEQTEDEILRKQIITQLAKDDGQIDRFKNNAEGFVFGVELIEEDIEEGYSDERSIEAYFADFRGAHDFGLSAKVSFIIKKCRIYPRYEEGVKHENSGDFMEMFFDSCGVMTKFYIYEPDQSDSESEMVWGYEDPERLQFQNSFIELPNPFELGDIVRYVGDSSIGYGRDLMGWGIVEVSQEDWYASQEKLLESARKLRESFPEKKYWGADYYDVQILTEFATSDYLFVHEHINPLNLEKYEPELDETESNFLEVAQWAVLGKCGLEYLSDIFRNRTFKALGEGKIGKVN